MLLAVLVENHRRQAVRIATSRAVPGEGVRPALWRREQARLVARNFREHPERLSAAFELVKADASLVGVVLRARLLSLSNRAAALAEFDKAVWSTVSQAQDKRDKLRLAIEQGLDHPDHIQAGTRMLIPPPLPNDAGAP